MIPLLVKPRWPDDHSEDERLEIPTPGFWKRIGQAVEALTTVFAIVILFFVLFVVLLISGGPDVRD